jgi:hypothetical protein
MAKASSKKLAAKETDALVATLKARFEKHASRHPKVSWAAVEARLRGNPERLWSVSELERTGGEPDVIEFDAKSGEVVFGDCAAESPKDRRSVCYDGEALRSRKENKPKASALELAAAMGVEVFDEAGYAALQRLGPFDLKTSSWIVTPKAVRELGGALFGDCRYERVFTYHNGAESYYAARGFRAFVRV